MAYDTHGTAVMVRVNRIIISVNAEFPGLTVAQKLEQVRSQNIKEREEDSTNIIGRDADYYFAGRKEVAASANWGSKFGKAALGNVAWATYGALKLGTEAIGYPEIMRTDKDKPNALAGGLKGMNLGIADGMADIGDRVTDIRLHASLDQDVPAEPRPSGIRRGST